MTITKKLLTTSVTVLAIAGMLLMASPAQAGFFDWFSSTPLSQEAAASKSISVGKSESPTFNPPYFPGGNPSTGLITPCNGTSASAIALCEEVCEGTQAPDGSWGISDASGSGSCLTSNAAPASGEVAQPSSNPIRRNVETKKAPVVQVKEEKKLNFFQSLFSRSKEKASETPLNQGVKSVTQPGNSTIPAAKPVSRVSDGGTVFDPNPEVVADAYFPCSLFTSVSNCQAACTDSGGAVNYFDEEGQPADAACYLNAFTAPVGGTNPLPTLPTYEFDSKIQEGDYGQEVVNLQAILAKLGYYKGRVDGDYGVGTKTAVKAFQRASGQSLTTGGVVGPKTRANLNAAISGAKTDGGDQTPPINPVPDPAVHPLMTFNDDGTCTASLVNAEGVQISSYEGTTVMVPPLAGSPPGTPNYAWCRPNKSSNSVAPTGLVTEDIRGYYSKNSNNSSNKNLSVPAGNIHSAASIVYNGTSCTVTLTEPVSGVSIEYDNGVTHSISNEAGTIVAFQCHVTINNVVHIFFIDPNPGTGVDLPDAPAYNPTLPTLPTYEFNKTLRKGDTGKDVIELQESLNRLGYNVGYADGVYGERTKEQLLKAQRAWGQKLTRGNIFGPISRANLKEELSRLGGGDQTLPTFPVDPGGNASTEDCEGVTACIDLALSCGQDGGIFEYSGILNTGSCTRARSSGGDQTPPYIPETSTNYWTPTGQGGCSSTYGFTGYIAYDGVNTWCTDGIQWDTQYGG